MTGCDSDIYTVAMVLPVQKKVRAADADEARSIVLKEQLVIASIGVSVGFPIDITVTKEYSDGGVGREATAR